MITARERGRSRERLRRLSGSSLDCDSLRREAVAELQHTIGFDRWCWPLADPDSLLPASGLAEHDYVPGVPRALELECSDHDIAAKHALARRADAATSMSAEIGGDLARSPRWDEVMRPVRIGDVAAVACAEFLATIAMLPSVIYPAAAVARSGGAADGAHALVQTLDHRWVRIEAALLEGDDDGQVAVTLRAATAAETFDLLCRAYALSRRERQVVAAVVAGLDTRATAERLFISPYTVQDHLKSVFDKAGVRSRRELLARFSGAAEPAA